MDDIFKAEGTVAILRHSLPVRRRAGWATLNPCLGWVDARLCSVGNHRDRALHLSWQDRPLHRAARQDFSASVSILAEPDRKALAIQASRELRGAYA